MTNEIIVVKQLPVIEQQLQQIKAEVAAKVEKALSLVCTEDTVKDIKAVRADLNKELKAWEDKRKEVKTAVMSPYEQFEAVYKDCISNTYKSADIELKSKIDSVEKELKERKQSEVIDYFNEYLASKEIDFVTFKNANINITLSASLKSLKEQAKAFIDKIADDLTLINTQNDKEEILHEYKQSLNVSAAITTVVNRHKAIEESKAREAERLQREQAAKETEAKVEKAIAPITAPTVEESEPILTINFTVKGTRAKLKELKEFLIKGGYDYE